MPKIVAVTSDTCISDSILSEFGELEFDGVKKNYPKNGNRTHKRIENCKSHGVETNDQFLQTQLDSKKSREKWRIGLRKVSRKPKVFSGDFY